MKRGSMKLGLAIVMLCAASGVSPARAEQKAIWQLLDEGEIISVIFGMPESDYVEISMSCTPNKPDITFVYVVQMPKARDGLRTEVTLVGKDVEYRIPVVGTRSEMDDAFILEGTFRMEPAVKRLFQDLGSFTARLKGEKDRRYSFARFRAEIGRFVETCR